MIGIVINCSSPLSLPHPPSSPSLPPSLFQTPLRNSPPSLVAMPAPHQHIIEGRNFLELCSVASSHGHGSSEFVQSKLEQEEVHVCRWDECGQQFSSLSQLVSHLEHHHTLSLQHYTCHWSGCTRERKPFDARYKLVTHLRCHTGERPYHCTYQSCTRKFSRLENLKLHTRTHTGEKPYTCHHEGCGKRFNNTSDRAKHMKTHITRKPYICKYPGCGKAYTDPSSMRKHNKFAHLQSKPVRSSSGDGESNHYRRPPPPPVATSNQPLLPTTISSTPPTLLTSSAVTMATVSLAESHMETSSEAVATNNASTQQDTRHLQPHVLLQAPSPRTSLVPSGAALGGAVQAPQMLLYTPQQVATAAVLTTPQTQLVSLLSPQLTHPVCPMIVSTLPGPQTVVSSISPSSGAAVMYQSLMPLMLPVIPTTTPTTTPSTTNT